jgi:hypothetical protein
MNAEFSVQNRGKSPMRSWRASHGVCAPLVSLVTISRSPLGQAASRKFRAAPCPLWSEHLDHPTELVGDQVANCARPIADQRHVEACGFVRLGEIHHELFCLPTAGC